MSAGSALAGNPLLDYGQIPRFRAITPEHVEPAIRHLVAAQNQGLAALEASVEPTWSGVVLPLRRLIEPLNFAWGAVNHLLSVRNAPALRVAHEAVQGEVVQAGMRLGQSETVFRALEAFLVTEGAALSPARRRIVEGLVRDAKLSGIALQGAERERFSQLEVELSELGTTFSNQLLDATKAFALELVDPADIEGLPATARAQAAGAARNAGTAGATADAGPWRITLDMPLFLPFMEHVTRRDLRERLYRGFITRASTAPTDNDPLIRRILAARREQARLLDFPDYAALSLSMKMAGDIGAVERLLAELRTAARSRAEEDLAELTAFARERLGDPAFSPRQWDIAFWSERQREARYAYSDEQLRPYFPFGRVLEGLFALARRLFAIDIRAADGEAEVWHDDVRFFRVHREDGAPIAAFFLDPFSRSAEKRGGAWMNVCLDRCGEAGQTRLPVAYLVCNQSVPVDGQPSLMSFAEVETLFHEFGHGLQHLLTRVDEPEVAGINRVEWDAVELPSQFMENWCYHQPTLTGLSCHVETGALLPADLFTKLTAARTYRAGSMFLRQINLATLDLELHRLDSPEAEGAVEAVVARVARANTVLAPLAEDRFLCGFSHIFAGGYAAGYYSYKWAEVLSADAFAAFEEAGLDDADAVSATGRRFRDTVLALGGSRHPAEVYRAFRGRDPSTEPLLRHNGLTAA